jgi:hypothetical protein
MKKMLDDQTLEGRDSNQVCRVQNNQNMDERRD